MHRKMADDASNRLFTSVSEEGSSPYDADSSLAGKAREYRNFQLQLPRNHWDAGLQARQSQRRGYPDNSARQTPEPYAISGVMPAAASTHKYKHATQPKHQIFSLHCNHWRSELKSQLLAKTKSHRASNKPFRTLQCEEKRSPEPHHLEGSEIDDNAGTDDDTYQEEVRGRIRSTIERFQAIALQRVETFIMRTWSPKKESIERETSMSMHINSKLLQSIRLEGLNACDLRAVLSLSEELRSYRVNNSLSGTSWLSSSPPHFRPPYMYWDHPGPLEEGATDFEIAPHFSTWDTAAVDQHSTQALDAIDERDGFSDILRSSETRSAHGGSDPTHCSHEAAGNPRCRTSAFDTMHLTSRNKSFKESPKTTDRAAVAAATAAEFLDLSSERLVPSALARKGPRRRSRQGFLKQTAFPQSITDTSPSVLSYQCSDMLPVKRAYRESTFYEAATETLKNNLGVEGGVKLYEISTGFQQAINAFYKRALCTKKLRAASVISDLLINSSAPSDQGTAHRQDNWSSSYSGNRTCENTKASSLVASLASIERPFFKAKSASKLPLENSKDPSLSSCRSPVKGVYYDSFKKLWRVQWQAPADSKSLTEGKRMSRSFSCTKLGFDLARARAVAWMLSGGLVGDDSPSSVSFGDAAAERSITISNACEILALEDCWKHLKDFQMKEFIVFLNPKRFFVKLETYYVSHKLYRGASFKTQTKGGLIDSDSNGIAGNSTHSSDGFLTHSRTAGGYPETPIATEQGALQDTRKKPNGGKRTHRLPFSSKQKSISVLSLEEMLEIVWGTPQEAAACIMAESQTGLSGSVGDILV